jgi:hypothetical protein
MVLFYSVLLWLGEAAVVCDSLKRCKQGAIQAGCKPSPHFIVAMLYRRERIWRDFTFQFNNHSEMTTKISTVYLGS